MHTHLAPATRRLAGILLVIIPTIAYGGTAILTLLIGDAEYRDNPMRQALWSAGHAHAGVLLVLALVMLRYVDEARLSPAWKWVARLGVPVAAILIPAAMFLSILPPATEPSNVIYMAYAGAVALAAAVLTLGIGLIRGPPV